MTQKHTESQIDKGKHRTVAALRRMRFTFMALFGAAVASGIGLAFEFAFALGSPASVPGWLLGSGDMRGRHAGDCACRREARNDCIVRPSGHARGNAWPCKGWDVVRVCGDRRNGQLLRVRMWLLG